MLKCAAGKGISSSSRPIALLWLALEFSGCISLEWFATCVTATRSSAAGFELRFSSLLLRARIIGAKSIARPLPFDLWDLERGHPSLS